MNSYGFAVQKSLLPRETWRTHKICKCGVDIQILYRLSDGADQIDIDRGGIFKSYTWPNYVYCYFCNRKHDLTKFKKIIE